jgi:hypothetical protein
MKSIISYLENPMEVGIQHQTITVDFSQVFPYLSSLLQEFIDTFEKEGKKAFPESFIKEREERLKDSVSKLETISSEDYLENLVEVLSNFTGLKSFPKELQPFLGGERGLLPLGHIIGRGIRRGSHTGVRIFNSRIIPKNSDVILIEKKYLSDNKYLFDVTSIKEHTIKDFLTFLYALPPLKDKIEIIKDRKHHSQRYVFRPYGLAVELWLEDESSVSLPPDLRSFLRGATHYIESNEWRTSIVLSAIGTESILADLYEEIFKKQAPDVPLGDLFRQVRDKTKIPTEILAAIDITNDARIAAVHRSRFEISNREAINALFGSTKFTIWYLSDF